MREPMDLPVAIWRFNHDPKYREAQLALAALARNIHKAQALHLLELCQGGDPSDFFDEIAAFRPSSYVIAELVVMAKKAQAKEVGRAGAAGRHAENYAIKGEVFAYLDNHPPGPRGMSRAATAIAGKLVPITYPTALAWIREWKKLRSAGRQ